MLESFIAGHPSALVAAVLFDPFRHLPVASRSSYRGERRDLLCARASERHVRDISGVAILPAATFFRARASSLAASSAAIMEEIRVLKEQLAKASAYVENFLPAILLVFTFCSCSSASPLPRSFPHPPAPLIDIPAPSLRTLTRSPPQGGRGVEEQVRGGPEGPRGEHGAAREGDEGAAR